MKKHYPLTFFLAMLALISTTVIQAQISIDPSPVYVDDIPGTQFEAVGYSFAVNSTNETRSYTWYRDIVEMTEGWSSAVCDKNLCYQTTTGQASFTLMPLESGTMDVHVYPGGIEGAAIITILLVNNNDESDYFEADYYFNQSSGLSERITNVFTVFPNPTSDYFTVDADLQIDRLEVFDIKGRKVLNFEGQLLDRYDISNLNNGSYILRFFDATNKAISTNVLIKK